MTKYMTKNSLEFTTKFGGHAYFSSLGLNRPEKEKSPPKTRQRFGRGFPLMLGFENSSITVMQSALVISWTRTS